MPAPALASWGAAPGTRTLLNLFLELSHGDCTLLLSPQPAATALVRAVHVATVHIRNRRSALLVETRQLLSDGTVRRRSPWPLYEKIRPGESPEAAASRAVREERVRICILWGRRRGRAAARGGEGVCLLPGPPSRIEPRNLSRVAPPLPHDLPRPGTHRPNALSKSHLLSIFLLWFCGHGFGGFSDGGSVGRFLRRWPPTRSPSSRVPCYATSPTSSTRSRRKLRSRLRG